MDHMELEQERGITITSAAPAFIGKTTPSTSSTRPVARYFIHSHKTDFVKYGDIDPKPDTPSLFNLQSLS